MPALDERRLDAVVAAVRGAGYADVVVDPEGYRRGRLNEALRVLPPA
jgi:hypothetical protein